MSKAIANFDHALELNPRYTRAKAWREEAYHMLNLRRDEERAYIPGEPLVQADHSPMLSGRLDTMSMIEICSSGS